MLIRPYRSHDEAACLAIFQSNTGDYFQSGDLDQFRRWLFRVLDDDDAAYLVVEDEDGTVVGCGGYIFNEAEQRAVLAWGMIHHDHHNRGIGEHLVHYRIEEIRRRMPEGRIITLDSTPRTQGFFEKLGFQTTRVKPGYYGKDKPAYEMEMTLRPEQV